MAIALESPNAPQLRRSIGLYAMIFYGVGTMVGVGFYALIGKVAGIAGSLSVYAFLLSAAIALCSGFSYAELCSRYPKSAGEAVYIKEAFDIPILSQIIGYAVILTGIVSAATLCVATDGFIYDILGQSRYIGVSLLVLILGAVACWGITQSVWLVVLITTIEVLGLVYVGLFTPDNSAVVAASYETVDGNEFTAIVAVVSAAFLAFYAYIGFEDMVNMAEEVKQPAKTLPIAIMVSIVVSTLLYIWVAGEAQSAITKEQLAESNTPLAAILGESSSAGWIRAVSILAGLNAALVQIVMASRVAYGMARLQQAPQIFARINAKTQTPLYATLVVCTLILILGFSTALITLAKITSALILFVFLFVNISLIKIKQRDSTAREGVFTTPVIISWFGAASCLAMLLFAFL